MRLIVILCLFYLVILNGQSVNDLYKQSMEAYKNKDYTTFRELNQKALKLHPSQPTILYNLTVSHALTGDLDKATNVLKRLLSWNASLDYTKDENLKTVYSDSIRNQEVELVKKQYQKTHVSSSLFREFTNSVHLEDMVKAGSLLFFTDVHTGNIYKYDSKTDVLMTLCNLPLAAMAIDVDKDGESLWVSTARLPNFSKELKLQMKPAIYKIAINSGKFLDSTMLPEKTVRGSMVLGKNGFYMPLIHLNRKFSRSIQMIAE